MKSKFLIIFAATALLIPVMPVQAHTGIGMTEGYANGFLHPLMGIDHLLTMLGIGLWGRILGGSSRWLLPAVFLIMMTCGAAVNFADFYVKSAETGISASVLILGLILCLDRSTQKGWALALVTLSAVGHGYMHAEEIDAGIDALSYLSGFLSSTTLLLFFGASFGFLSPSRLNITKKVFGLVCAVTGLTLLTGM